MCLPTWKSSHFYSLLYSIRAKESACNIGDAGWVPGLGRSLGGGHDNSLQYSCLKNPMDRRAWQAIAHWVTKSRTWWSNWACAHTYSIMWEKFEPQSQNRGNQAMQLPVIKLLIYSWDIFSIVLKRDTYFPQDNWLKHLAIKLCELLHEQYITSSEQYSKAILYGVWSSS